MAKTQLTEDVMGKQKSSEKSAPGKLTFEQALEKLEQFVTRLEDGQLGLDQSLAAYEQAMDVLKQCYDQLEQAERHIELLTGVDADGNVVTQPFAEEGMSLEEKQQARSRRRSRPTQNPVVDETPIDEPPTLF